MKSSSLDFFPATLEQKKLRSLGLINFQRLCKLLSWRRGASLTWTNPCLSASACVDTKADIAGYDMLEIDAKIPAAHIILRVKAK